MPPEVSSVFADAGVAYATVGPSERLGVCAQRFPLLARALADEHDPPFGCEESQSKAADLDATGDCMIAACAWQLRKLLPDSALASHGLLTMREEWNARRARRQPARSSGRPPPAPRGAESESSPAFCSARPSGLHDGARAAAVGAEESIPGGRASGALDDASDLRAFIRGVRNNAYGCDGFLLGVADLCGVPIVVDSMRRMAQVTWPTEVAAPRYVLHLFLQHDKHCVAIARVAAAADGLGAPLSQTEAGRAASLIRRRAACRPRSGCGDGRRRRRG